MSKDNEIRFVGQPIFKQIIKLIDAVNISVLVKKHSSDHYYKAFKIRTQLITMLFGILSRCDSMTEICEGLRALGGKLNHLGMEKAPAKSTASDGLRNRSHKFCEDLYFSLVKNYQPFLSENSLLYFYSRKINLVGYCPSVEFETNELIKKVGDRISSFIRQQEKTILKDQSEVLEISLKELIKSNYLINAIIMILIENFYGSDIKRKEVEAEEYVNENLKVFVQNRNKL